MHGLVASSHEIWCRYLYPIRSYWHFSEIEDGGRRHLRFSDYVNLAIRACWQCGICALYQIGLKCLHWSLRSMHLGFRHSFDDVTWINYWFQLLVTWSSPHGRDASSHKIWCRHLYELDIFFPKLKMAAAAILALLGEPWDHPWRHIHGAYCL